MFLMQQSFWFHFHSEHKLRRLFFPSSYSSHEMSENLSLVLVAGLKHYRRQKAKLASYKLHDIVKGRSPSFIQLSFHVH